MKKRKTATTPLDDGQRATLGWRLWWVCTCALRGCSGCTRVLLTEGPLHA